MAEDLGDIVYTVGADVDPLVSSTKQVDTQMEKMNQSFKKADTSGAKLTKTSSSVRTALSGVGKSAGQAGIQVQQFIGQIQGGQSAMVALSQQSADLGFVLGAPLLGAIAGISASLVSILIPSLFEASESAEDLTEKLQDLVKASTLTENQSRFLVSQTNDEIDANKRLISESEERRDKIQKIVDAYDILKGRQEAGIKLSEAEAAFVDLQASQQEKLSKEILKESASIDTLNGNITTLTRKRDAYNLSTEKSLNQQKEEAKSIQKVNTALKSFSDAVDLQVKTLGMSDRELAQYKATMLGASEATKDQIDLIYDHKDALEAQKNAAKEAKAAVSMATGASPSLSIGFQQEGAEQALQATYDSGLISEQEYLSQKLALNEQYENQVQQLQEERFRRENEGMAFILDSMDALQSASTSALTGMLQGTMTLQEAFASLANTILNQAVGALVDLGFEYLKNQVIAESAAAASVATGVATGAALASAYMPAATAASIATFGAAAATGATAVTTAVTSTQALAFAGGRESGGPVSSDSFYRMGEGNKPEILQTSSGMYGIPGDSGRVFNSQQLDQIGGGNGQMSIQIINEPGTVSTVVSQSDQNAIIRTAVTKAVGEVRKEYQNSMNNRNGVYFNGTAQNYGQGKASGRNY